MAPCFPGVELWILGPKDDVSARRTIATTDWSLLAWGRKLMRHDVSTLLCAGIDRFVWGSLQGYGIEVVPAATGPASEILAMWRVGALEIPEVWPAPNAAWRGRPGRFGRRFRGGRGWHN